MALFCEREKSMFTDAIASPFLAMQAAWWLRDRVPARLYLAVHPRTGRFPFAVHD
jgi:hypothetical protein